MNFLLKLSFILFITLNVSTAFSQDNNLKYKSIIVVNDISNYAKKNGKTFKDYQIFFISKEENKFTISNGAAVGIPQTNSEELIILKNPEFSGSLKIFTKADNILHSINEKNLNINTEDLLILYTKENLKINSIIIK